MILVFGIGSLVLMPLVGAVIARDGSQRILRATALVMAPLLLIITLVPTWSRRRWLCSCLAVLSAAWMSR